MSNKDKKFIGAIAFASVGFICLAITYNVEMAVHRIQGTLDHKFQIQNQINKTRLDMQDHLHRKQGFKPLKELLKEDQKEQLKNNKKNKEVL